jgi:hypothetical protein
MWRNLNVRFKEELSALRSHSSIWVLPRVQSMTIDKLYDQFESLDEECGQEVEQAIRQWTASGLTNWPRMSDKARAMLKVRFETAEQLLHLLILRQAEVLDETAAAKDWNVTTTARRILINWWKERGQEMGADIWVFQQWSRTEKRPLEPQPQVHVSIPARESIRYAAVA